MKNSYTQRGSLTIGYNKLMVTSFIWPFSNLTATESTITLKLLWIRYELNKSNINSIRQYNNTFINLGRGLQFIHTNNDCPRFLVFWSFNQKKLSSELQRLGYTIDATG